MLKHRHIGSLCLAASLLGLLHADRYLPAGEADRQSAAPGDSTAWQDNAVDYARIMSRVKWTPVADGMPTRRGTFEKGTEYTGVPYSSVTTIGRTIGFDIFLKTFLAAVENPQSVLYTEDLSDRLSNGECYYGKVCSSYTSYALQCGYQYVSRLHGPSHRPGVVRVEPQSAQAAEVGDIIYTPPVRPQAGSHIELVTEVTVGGDGQITHVRVEESRPRTTKVTNYRAEEFDGHLAARDRKLARELYRITDWDAWRGDNRAESFQFPNYREDSAAPTINRVLLLDRGDWVPYHRGQAVKINIMDRDAEGVESLVIKRGETIVEEISRPGKGVIERGYSECGNYTAHCVMHDGSLSQACEFAVCDLNCQLPTGELRLGEPWKLSFQADNMRPILVRIVSSANKFGRYMVVLTDEDRASGTVTIPSEVMQHQGATQVWLIGENRYGRLKVRKNTAVR